ncbi:putative galactose mutarotase-like domain superfamily [Dioscorea sansibarensis]
MVFLSVSFDYLKLPERTSFYGTGEDSGQLERTGKWICCFHIVYLVFTWNTDAWGYGSTTLLYRSRSWVLTVLCEGRSLGF